MDINSHNADCLCCYFLWEIFQLILLECDIYNPEVTIAHVFYLSFTGILVHLPWIYYYLEYYLQLTIDVRFLFYAY